MSTFKRVVFGAINKGSSATWTLGAPVATLPVANAFDGQPSKPVRLGSADICLSNMQGDFGAVTQFGLFGAFGHNMTNAALWRVRLSSSPIITETLLPSGMEAQSGVSGTGAANLAKILEAPESDDGQWIAATSSTTSTSIRVSFPTPARNVLGGNAKYGRVRLLVRKNGGATAPTLAVNIKEAGVLRLAALTGRQVSSASGESLCVEFDPAVLQTASGADLEVEVVGTASANATVEFGAVRVAIDLVGTSYDSGYREAKQAQGGFGALAWGLFEWGVNALPDDPDLALFNKQALILPEADLTARYCRVDFYDPSNPDGYIDIGELYLGPVLRPSRNPTYGVEVGADNDSDVVTTPAGIDHVEARPSFLTLRMTFSGLTADEAFNKMLRDIDLRLGKGGAMVCVLFPAETSLYQVTAGLFRQRNLGSVTIPSFRSHSKTFELKQLL